MIANNKASGSSSYSYIPFKPANGLSSVEKARSAFPSDGFDAAPNASEKAESNSRAPPDDETGGSIAPPESRSRGESAPDLAALRRLAAAEFGFSFFAYQ